MNDETERKEDEPETASNGEDELGADNEALAAKYYSMQIELAEVKKSVLRKDGKPLARPPAGAIDRIAELHEILTVAGQPLEAPEEPDLDGNLICSACKTPYAGHESEFTREGPGILRHRCAGLAMKM